MFISDAPKASFEDVSYALSCFLVTVTTKNSSTPSTGPVRLSFVDDNLELPRYLTFAASHEGKTSNEEIPESLYCAAYLGKDAVWCYFKIVGRFSKSWGLLAAVPSSPLPLSFFCALALIFARPTCGKLFILTETLPTQAK